MTWAIDWTTEDFSAMTSFIRISLIIVTFYLDRDDEVCKKVENV